MKRLTCCLVLLLSCGYVKAQIVNIPDVNFKTRLLNGIDTNYYYQWDAGDQVWVFSNNGYNYLARDENNQPILVDANGDGEIQLIEAQAVYTLRLDGGFISQAVLMDETNYNFYRQIADLTGLNAFTNLRKLYCGGNSFTTLDLPAELSLDSLIISNPHYSDCYVYQNEPWFYNYDSNATRLISLNTENLGNLKYLDLRGNSLQNFNSLLLTDLNFLSIQNDAFLKSLDLSNSPHLNEFIAIDNPHLDTLNLKNGGFLSSFNVLSVLCHYDFYSTFVKYICVDDEAEKDSIQSYFTTHGVDDVVIDTVCNYPAVEIHSLSDNILEISPNPAEKNVNIHNLTLGSTISISDLSGEVVYSTKVSIDQLNVNIENLSNGIYFVNVGNSCRKLIVQK